MEKVQGTSSRTEAVIHSRCVYLCCDGKVIIHRRCLFASFRVGATLASGKRRRLHGCSLSVVGGTIGCPPYSHAAIVEVARWKDTMVASHIEKARSRRQAWSWKPLHSRSLRRLGLAWKSFRKLSFPRCRNVKMSGQRI